jgi:hypothetical protein
MASTSRIPLGGSASNPGIDSIMSHPRSISADVLSAPSTDQIISRLTQQNSRIREAWEAERKYMEANRERVEEVYKEERFIMEEERAGWENEKSLFLEEIQLLRNRIGSLEDEKIALVGTVQRFELERAGKVAGVVVPMAGLRGGGGDGSSDTSYSSPSLTRESHRGPLTNGTHTDPFSLLQSGSDSFSPVHLRSQYLNKGILSISPTQQPESSPFIPLDPNIPPLAGSSVDFLLPSPKDEIPIPIVDVQEIHPELEGIPIKSTAVKKSTFTDSDPSPASNSKTSSRNPSPPGDVPKPVRASSKAQTLHLLTATETDRLIMHAGHTPSHSLSHFPTAAATEAATEVATVAGDSGDSTPTRHTGETAINTAQNYSATDPGLSNMSDLSMLDDDHPEAMLDPSEDVGLKGPLMVRNIPAQDEIFFKKLSEKLEDVSRGEDAVPTCLKAIDSVPTVDSSLLPKPREEPGTADDEADKASVSTSHTDRESSDLEESKGKDVDMDIPLKFKKSSNFGAPFGAM